jgi:hypothetical protein
MHIERVARGDGDLIRVCHDGPAVAGRAQLERIDTWNAAANKHMIAINEALGFEITGKPARSWEREI